MTDDDYGTLQIRGKLANGLYAEHAVITAASVAFHLYAARPFEPADIAAYALADDAGTEYTVALPTEPVEGRFVLVFEPGAPRSWGSLSLSRPGHSLVVVRAT